MKTGTVMDLFGGVRGTAFAVVALVCAIAALGIGLALKASAARLDACTTKGKNYLTAQDHNLATIETLRTQIYDMVAKRAAEKTAADDAAKALDAENKKIAADLAATEEELQDAYRNSPTARAWSRTGVDRAVVDRLPRPD